LSPYYLVAKAYGADVKIVRVVCDPEVAAARNAHGVPEAEVRRIAAVMEDPPPYWDCEFEVINNESER
jgi:hypothetical protein